MAQAFASLAQALTRMAQAFQSLAQVRFYGQDLRRKMPLYAPQWRRLPTQNHTCTICNDTCAIFHHTCAKSPDTCATLSTQCVFSGFRLTPDGVYP